MFNIHINGSNIDLVFNIYDQFYFHTLAFEQYIVPASWSVFTHKSSAPMGTFHMTNLHLTVGNHRIWSRKTGCYFFFHLVLSALHPGCECLLLLSNDCMSLTLIISPIHTTEKNEWTQTCSTHWGSLHLVRSKCDNPTELLDRSNNHRCEFLYTCRQISLDVLSESILKSCRSFQRYEASQQSKKIFVWKCSVNSEQLCVPFSVTAFSAYPSFPSLKCCLSLCCDAVVVLHQSPQTP